ncbi:MAG: TonB-dependent receptor [Tannerellaceae bacterium]|jgi:TonB-linked SusC/RagA family outer membrane protein|nr:TonB-dependent receptor [Tannerellaceae bacterium]
MDVYLKEKKRKSVFKLLLLCGVLLSSHVFAQAQTVTGRVVDSQNEPLIGVSIQVKGTTTGNVTDIDGNYSISASAGATLVFSYVGFATQEIVVGNQTVVNVKMSEDTRSLEEVVVVGYGTLKRKEITSSIEVIRAEDFNQGASRNAMDLIQGKIAGLHITRPSASNPNAGSNIQLRGVASVNGGKSPLVVIDGIPDGNLDLLQPNDIESFSVLKDGSAAAIYGTRANSGVILVTTKKGRAGEPRFEYNGYVQHETVSKKPDYLTAAEFRDLIKQGIIDESMDFGTSTDLYDELINKSNLTHYHNFAASGGTQNGNYRASIYFSDADAIAVENSRRQFGGRVSVFQKGMQDRLTFTANLATNFNDANLLGGETGDFEQAIQRNPTMPLFNEDGSFYETEAFATYNPLSRNAYRIKRRNQQTTSADAKLQFEIIDGLSVSATGTYQKNAYNDREYKSIKDWDQRPTTNELGTGKARKYNYLSWRQTFESTIDYRKIFNEVHSVTALAGYSYNYFTREEFSAETSGFTTDAFMDWNLEAATAMNDTRLPRPSIKSNKYDNTLIGFFGRVNYSYNDKYHFQASLRHEGSSKFGANHKWGNFPSISAGWSLSEESFMEGIDWISELKVRGGYGVTGNDGLSEYQSLTTLGTGGVYPQNGVFYQTYGAARNPNPNLKWEQKKELNFGIDFAVLDRRITGSLDYYSRTTQDLLFEYNASQPPYVRDKIWANVGSLVNNGFEIQMSALAVSTGDFSWNIDLAASTQTNKLDKLSNDVFSVDYLEFYGLPSPGNLGDAIRLQPGEYPEVGTFFGKRYAGLTDDGKWLFYKKDGTTGPATAINEDDKVVIGNGVPKFYASLNNTFRYKNFDLTVFLRGKFGFDILNTKEMYFGNKKWLPNNMLKSAITKHNAINDDPQYSDYYVEKGDFVKLDNVTLGYTFNNLKTKYIRNLRLYVTGKNLMTISGYTGINPEVDDTGLEPGIDGRGLYPVARQWTFGLNIGF